MSDAKKYHCKNCDHVWEGDEYELDCQNCQSEDIEIAADNTELRQGRLADEEKSAEPSGTSVYTEEEIKEEEERLAKAEDGSATKEQASEEKAHNLDSNQENEIEDANASIEGLSEDPGQEDSDNPPEEEDFEDEPILGGGPKEKKKKSKHPIVIGGLVLIVPLLIWLIMRDSDTVLGNDNPNDNGTGNSGTTEVTDGVEVALKVEKRNKKYYLRGTVTENGQETDLDLNQVTKLYRLIDQKVFEFDKRTGEIYFCESDGEDLSVFQITLEGKNIKTFVNNDAIMVDLEGSKPNPKAQCVYPIDPEDITLSVDKRSCRVSVSVRNRSRYQKLSYSFNGIDASYGGATVTMERLKNLGSDTYNVFVKQEGFEPVAYLGNGSEPVHTCTIDPEKELAELVPAIKKFCLDPTNSTLQDEISDRCTRLSGKPQFHIDNQVFEGFPGAANKMYSDARNARGEGKKATFSLISAEVENGSNDSKLFVIRLKSN